MEEDDWEENPFENRPTLRKDYEKAVPPPPEEAPPSPEREGTLEEEPFPPAVAKEENPFEARSEISSPLSENDENPFENRPVDTFLGHEADEELIAYDEFDRSKLSFVSGIGFVALGFVVYFFVILPDNTLLLTLTVPAIVLSVLVAFFYLLDDLKIRTTKLTERGARFLSGIFFMILIILLFVPLVMEWPNIGDIDLTIPLTLVPIIVLTHASVALFLYSMLWEE